jgi:hypothetical protein
MNWTRRRFSFGVALTSPSFSGHGQWPRARTHFLEAFKPKAARYRYRTRLSIALLFGSMLGGFIFVSLSPSGIAAAGGVLLFAACLLSSVVIHLFGRRLICPACKKRLEPARGLYCPQCGSDKFQRGTHKSGPSLSRYIYCPSCDGRIMEDDGDSARSYRIRGCTHCGVMLDEAGL